MKAWTVVGARGQASRRALTRVVIAVPPAQGFSLVECLVVNALALVLVAGLFAATAGLVVTAQTTAALSDQAVRARQVIRFVEQSLLSARMPAKWVGGDEDALFLPGWHTPSAVCEPPITSGSLWRWGGINVIQMTDFPCVARGDGMWGLYIEQIEACPEDCGHQAGYVISPQTCSGPSPLVNQETQWQVEWQANMDVPAHCDTGWPWGRLQRRLLSDRSAEASVEALPTLRLQSLATTLPYRWYRAETLIAGIAQWHPRLIPSASSEDSADGVDAPRPWFLSLGLTVMPDDVAPGLKDLRVVRLLSPSGVSAID